jgi:death-on-curing protein
LTDCERGTIESALAAPRAGWGPWRKYPDLPSKAAALTYALAKSQACVDGNKRAALILLRAFLHINGATLRTAPGSLADMILDAASSESERREEVVTNMTDWLRERIVVLSEEES